MKPTRLLRCLAASWKQRPEERQASPRPNQPLIIALLAGCALTLLAGSAAAQDAARYEDANGDGRIDRIVITGWSSPVSNNAETGDWTISIPGMTNAAATGGGSWDGSISGYVVPVSFTPSAHNEIDTDVSGGSISYSATAGTDDSLKTDGGDTDVLSFSLSPTDGCGPVIVMAVAWQTGIHGIVTDYYRYIDVKFSEDVSPVSTGSRSRWTVPSSTFVETITQPSPDTLRFELDRDWYRGITSPALSYDGQRSGSYVRDTVGTGNHMLAQSGTAVAVRIPDTQYRVVGFEDTRLFDIDAAAATGVVSSPVQLQRLDFGVPWLQSSSPRWTLYESGSSVTSASLSSGAGMLDRTASLSDSSPAQAAYTLEARYVSSLPHGASFITDIRAVRIRNTNWNNQNVITFSVPDRAGSFNAARDTHWENVESGTCFAAVKATPIAPQRVDSSRIFEEDSEVSLLDIDLAGSGETLEQVKVRFVTTSYGQFDPAVDLRPLADGAGSGVLLKDKDSGNVIQLSTTGLEWSPWKVTPQGKPYREVTLKPLNAIAMPPNDEGGNDAPELEIAIQKSSTFGFGDAFYAEIPDNGFQFSSGTSGQYGGSKLPAWTTQDGQTGAPTAFYYRCSDTSRSSSSTQDRRWNATEEIVRHISTWLFEQEFYDGGSPFRSLTTSGGSHLMTNDHGLPDRPATQLAIYYNGEDYWYDVGGQRGVYDAGTDIPICTNREQFYRRYAPNQEGARSVEYRASTPAVITNIVSNGQSIAANSDATAILGIRLQDSGRTWMPRILRTLDQDGGDDVLDALTIEAVSKNMPAGNHSIVWDGTTISVDGEPNPVVGGEQILNGPNGIFFVARIEQTELAAASPASPISTNVVVSSDRGRDIEQPTALPGVRVHAVGPGNVVGSTIPLTIADQGTHWEFTWDGPAIQRTLTAATNIGGGQTRFTTSMTHGLTVGDTVRIAGTDGGTYDGVWQVTNVPTNATFDVNVAYSDGISTGTATLIDLLSQAGTGYRYVTVKPGTNQYLILQVDLGRIAAGTQNLQVYSSRGRTITPFLNIEGLEIMAVDERLEARTNYSVEWLAGAGALSFEGGPAVAFPTASDTAFVRNPAGEYLIVRQTGTLSGSDRTDSLAVNQTRLGGVQLMLGDVNGFPVTTHLKPLTSGPDSGVALYRDANGNGVLDGEETDEPVPLRQTPVWNPDGPGSAGQYLIRLYPEVNHLSSRLDGSPRSPAGNYSYFVAVKTTSDVTYGDQVRVNWARAYEPSELPSSSPLGVDDITNTFRTAATGAGQALTVRTVTNTIFVDLTTPGQTVDAGETTPVSLFGVDHWIGNGDNVFLTAITFTINNENNFDPEEDLLPINGFSGNSGLLLYAGGSRINFAHLAFPVFGATTYILYPTGNGIPVPKNSTGIGNIDLDVRFLPSDDINFMDAFSLTILASNGLEYTTGFGSPNADLTTNVITATVPTLYGDLSSHTQAVGIPGLLINAVDPALAAGTYGITMWYDPASGEWWISWGGGSPQTLDMTAITTYTLYSSSGRSLELTFDPIAFLNEDTLVDGDGTATPAAGVPDIPLDSLLTPLTAVSTPGGLTGDVYYIDHDTSRTFSEGDAIVLAGNDDLVYNVGTDQLILGSAADGDPLRAFVASDQLGFFDAAGDGYSDGDDIVRDTDGIYTLPWLDRLLDTDGTFTAGLGSPSGLRQGAVLVNAETVSLPAGTPTGGSGGLYYYDADDSGGYSRGDDIVLLTNVGGRASLTFQAGDAVIQDGGDGTQVIATDPVSQFTAADMVWFEQGGPSAAAYDDGDDILRATSSSYTPPTLTATFRTTPDTRTIRAYNSAFPSPFNTTQSATSGVLGIDAANGGDTSLTMDSLTVRFENLGGFNALSDLRPLLANSSASGVTLYRDADGNGVFNPRIDTLVPLSAAPAWSGIGTSADPYRLTLSPAPATGLNQVSSTIRDGIYDFFVAVQPSPTVNDSQEQDNGDSFRARIDSNDIVFSRGANSQQIVGSEVTVDTRRPGVVSALAYDTDADGFLEELVIEFHETLVDSVADADDWVITDADGTDLSPASDADITVGTTQVTIALPGDRGTTGPVYFELAYDTDLLGLFDAATNPAQASDLSVDSVVPRIVRVTTHDNDAAPNGLIDHIMVTFSEEVDFRTFSNYIDPVTPFDAGTDWSFGSYTGLRIHPAGKTSDSIIRFSFDEADLEFQGDTDATPDLVAAAGALEDMAGNPLPASSALTTDEAPPVPVDAFADRGLIEDIPSGELRIQDGTILTVVFSEPVDFGAATLDVSDIVIDRDGPGPLGTETIGDLGVTNSDMTIVNGELQITIASTALPFTEEALLNLASPITGDSLEDAMELDARANADWLLIRGLGSIQINQLATLDTDLDGYLDTVRLTFSRPVDDSTLDVLDPGVWTLTNTVTGVERADLDFLPGGPDGNDPDDDEVIYLTFREAPQPDTGLQLTLEVQSSALVSLNNEPFAQDTFTVDSVDEAAPQIMDVTTYDANQDGSVDTAVLRGSEIMDPAGADAADFTIGGNTADTIQYNPLLAVADAGGGEVTFTTQMDHYLVTGDTVMIMGSANYDGIHTVTAAPASDQFTLASAYTAETFAGAVAIAGGDKLVLQLIGPNQVAGTEYKPVDYTAGDLEDLAGNALASVTDAGLRSKTDRARPRVAAARTLSDRAVEVTFTEAVTNIQPGDVTADGGAVAFDNVATVSPAVHIWSRNDATWNTDATGGSAGAPGSTDSTGVQRTAIPDLSIAADSINDLALNSNSALSDWPGTIDNADPVVVQVTVRDEVGGMPDGTVDTAEVIFSEPVDDDTVNASLADFTLGGDAITGMDTGLDADDHLVILTHGGVPGTDYKVLDYDVPNGTVADLVGNPLAAGTDLGLTQIDDARPVVLSAMTRSDSSIEVTFSEAVDPDSVDAADLLAGLTYTVSFSGTPTVDGDTVTWTDASATWNTDATGTNAGVGTDSSGVNSTIVPQIKLDTSAVSDLDGNGNVAVDPFTDVEDGAAPVVLLVDSTRAPGIYTEADLIPIQVHFSEVVQVTDTPVLGLNVGIGSAYEVDYSSGTGTDVLVFNYTVAADHNRITPDYLEVWDADALTLPDSSAIKDAALAANDAVLTLPTSGANALSEAQIEVDNTPPAVVDAMTMDQNTVRVTFSEPLSNDAGNILANVGQVGILDDADAFLAFENVTADAAGATPLMLGSTYTTLYYHMTTDARFWNTDATGTAAGTGTDHSGTSRANVPAVQVQAGALLDRAGQGIGATDFTGTTDGASPVFIAAAYRDNGADGSVDRIDASFSETVTFTDDAAFLASWNIAANDLTGLGVTALTAAGSGTRTVTLSVDGTTDLTGVPAGDLEPDVGYTGDAASPLVDVPGNTAVDFAPAVMTDAAGPAIVAARQVSRLTVEVTLSENVPDSGLDGADFDLAGFADNGVWGADTGSGLNDDTVLVLKNEEVDLDETGTVAFSAGDVLADRHGVGNAQTASVATAPLSDLIEVTDPLPNDVFSNAVDPNVIISGTVAARRMSSWTLYYAPGLNPANPDLLEFTRFEGTPAASVINGELGTWSIDGLDDGIYTIRLRVVMDDPTVANWGTNETPVDIDIPVELDATAPTVVEVTTDQPSGTYGEAQTFNFYVTFTEPVFVNCAPSLSPSLLLNTTPAQSATYMGGSGTTTLVFTYTVQGGDATADLDYDSSAAFMAGGCSVRDLALNPADTTLPDPGTAGSISDDKDIVIDTSGPDLLVYSPTNPLSADQIVTYSYTPGAAFHGVPVTGRALADDVSAEAASVIRVEVSADDGGTWIEADLDPVDGSFSYTLDLLDPTIDWGDRDPVTPYYDGLYNIRVRATDELGRTTESTQQVWLERDMPTADILMPPQNAFAMRGMTHGVTVLVQAPYFGTTTTEWWLEGTADGDFSSGVDTIASGSTTAEYMDVIDVPMPAAGSEYVVRLVAMSDGFPSVAIHRFRLHDGISGVETVDSNANGSIDAIRVSFSAPVDIIDWDNDVHGIEAAFEVDGYSIAADDYSAENVTSLTLKLVESGSVDTDVLPLVSYVDNHTILFNNTLSPFVPDFSLAAADASAPILVAAESRSDRSVALFFSEPLDLSTVNPADLTVDGSVSFTQSAADSGPDVIVWSTGAAAWNTDANGTSAGAGTDAEGTNHDVVLSLTIPAGAFADVNGNPFPGVTDDDRTADSAPPVLVSAQTLSDRSVELTLSEAVSGADAADLSVNDAAISFADYALVDPLVHRWSSASASWNTDATGSFVGSAASTDSLGNHRDATVDLTIAAASFVDAAGNDFEGVGNWSDTADGTPPAIVDAMTMDQNTVRVTLSEPLSNDAGNILANVGQVGILDDADAFLAFENVTADAAGATPLTAGSTYTTLYYHMTTDARFWNTDATGASAGTGTDHSGASRANVPAIQVQAGALLDSAGQGIVATDFTGTTDGAPPVFIAAAYRDNGADGSVDRIDASFSETVTFTDDAAFLASWNIAANDLTGLGVTALTAAGSGTRTVTLTVDGTTDLTGVPAGDLEPEVGYAADAASPLVDMSGNTAVDVGPAVVIDAAGPAIVAARQVSRLTVEVTLSENVPDSGLDGADFALAGFADNGVWGADTGSRLNDDTILVLKNEEVAIDETGTVAFSGGDVLADRHGVGNDQTASVATAPLSDLIEVTDPLTNDVFSNAVNPNVIISGTVAARRMSSWTLYYAPGLNPGNPDLLEFKRVEGIPAASIINGELATWSIDGLSDGIYTIRLRVVMDDPSVANWGINETPVDIDIPVEVDATAPTIVDVTADQPSGTYGESQTFNISVTFTEPVVVNCAPTLSPYLVLNTTPPQWATFVGGSGSTTLVFTYTVQEGDATADLDYDSSTAFMTGGCSVRDLALNPADTTLPDPGTAGSISDDKDIVIDTSGPDLLVYSPTDPLGVDQVVTYSYTPGAAFHGVPVTGRALADDISAEAASVTRVEITADDGGTWVEADLDPVDGSFSYTLDLLDPAIDWGDRDPVTPYYDGLYDIKIRAYDDLGRWTDSTQQVWLERDMPTADILMPPQNAFAMRGMTHGVTVLVQAPYFGTTTDWWLEGTADGDFSSGVDSIASGATTAEYTDVIDVTMPADGSEYVVRLVAASDGTQSVAIHRFRLHDGISAVETVDSNANGSIDGIRVSFSAPVDIIDWDNDVHGIEAAFEVDGYSIVAEDYSADNVTSLTLKLVESGSVDTDVLPLVSYVDNHTVVFTNTLSPFVPDFSLAATDAAAPILVAAESRSDRSVALFFSEPLDLSTVNPADLTVDGSVSFTQSAADSGPDVILWTAGAAAWNTDANGTSAGAGTDAEGTNHDVVLSLTIPAAAFADVNGNPFPGVTDDGRTMDSAPPVLVSAQTLSDRSVELTLSEPVSGADAADLSVNGAAISFADYALIDPLVHRWSSASASWNTDATGSFVGAAASTDSLGNHRDATVDLTIAAASFEDAAGNDVEGVADWDETADAAPPVALEAMYYDNSVDPLGQARVDTVEIRLSEPVLLDEYEDMDWDTTSNPGSVGLQNETSAVASQHTLELSVLGALNTTGGLLNPTVAYTRAAGIPDSLKDQVGNPANDFALDVLDQALPRIIAARYQDVDYDGLVDRIEVDFSEQIVIDNNAGWTLQPNDMPVDAGSLSAPVLEADLASVSFSVTATDLKTGVDPAAGELEPVIGFDLPGRILDRSAAANPAVATSVALTDRAGPVLLTARAATQTVIDVTFSERLDGTTVQPADFSHDALSVVAVEAADGWFGARLTLSDALTWGQNPGAVAFSDADVVADGLGNPNGDVATVQITPPLQALVYFTGPALNTMYQGDTPVPVTGRLDISAAPPADDLSMWSLYLVQGQGDERLPVDDPSTVLLGDGIAPLPSEGTFADLIPSLHATPGVYAYTLVLRVGFNTGEADLMIYRPVFAAADVPVVGMVNDGASGDIDYQSSTTTLIANWTGFNTVALTPASYIWAAGTDPDGYGTDVVDWTNVGLSTSASRDGLSLVHGQTYIISVIALDSAGNAVARNYSDGVRIDAVGPAAGTVLDGPVPGDDIAFQQSGTHVAANWFGFADDAGGSGIATYEWALFAQGGASADPGTDNQVTGWMAVGNVTVASTVLESPLTHDQVYYAAVRAIDAVGNIGPIAVSDGFQPDLTAPVTAVVRDGLGEDIDLTPSTTELSANWDAFEEPDSGLRTYQYRVVRNLEMVSEDWERKTTPSTGALNMGRTRFGVTKLLDGRVMAVGGWTGVAARDQVEIYNPQTGAWAFSGSLNEARYGAAVATLPDGDVIVAGGSNGSDYLTSIERYDTLTGTWSIMGHLSEARENPAIAVRPDGTVWVIGGRGAVNPAVPALAGFSAVVDEINPALGTVTAAGAISTPRAGAAAHTLPDNRLLVIGGEAAAGSSSTVDVYDGSWSSHAMPTARDSFASVMLPDGDVMVIGGLNAGGKLQAVERFDADTDSWSPVAPMSTPRAHFDAVWVEATGNILAVGGINDTAGFEVSCEAYDPDNDIWMSAPSLNHPRGYHRAVIGDDGQVMALGGLVNWLFLGETEVLRYAETVSPWYDTNDTQGTVSGLSLIMGETYTMQVRAFDNVGNRSAIASSDGVTVTPFNEAPVIVSLMGPDSVTVGETFDVMVYVRENNPGANGFRGGPIDLTFTPANGQVTVHGGFSPFDVLAEAFTSLDEDFVSGSLDNVAGMIDELGGATLTDGLGEGPAPGALYATIPFTATASGSFSIAAGPGDIGLVLSPPIGIVPAVATDFGEPLTITVTDGVTLSVQGGVTSVDEGQSFVVQASLSAPASETVTVDLGFAGTATHTDDYVVSVNPLVIPSGSSWATTTVTVADDGVGEANETVQIFIEAVNSLSGAYMEVDEQVVTVTIRDSGIPGDANGDGMVNIYDLWELIEEYGIVDPGPEDLDSDFDNDGDVDYYDLLILIAHYDTATKAAAKGLASKGGPSATITLDGPERVQPGEIFNVDLYVQVNDSRGFGGGPLDVAFSTALLDYAGTFDPHTVIQPPLNAIDAVGDLDELAGVITELGGATVSGGLGYGTPVHYARMSFQAGAEGTATFDVSAGSEELKVVGGSIPFASTTYGTLSVVVSDDNVAPTAASLAVTTAAGQPVEIALSGDDLDGDELAFNLPEAGTATDVQHGTLTVDGAVVDNSLTVTYTPEAGFVGEDTFFYTVDDGDAVSEVATVTITVGGFLTDIQVISGSGAYATLTIGMQAGGSNAVSPDEGDQAASTTGAFLLGPDGDALDKDIRAVKAQDLWKLEIRVPGGSRETWDLAWLSDSFTDTYLATITPAGNTWRADGGPVDMTSVQSLPLINDTADTMTFRFLIAVSTEQQMTLSLQPGWNVVGVPIMLAEAQQNALLTDERIVEIAQYSAETGYTTPTSVVPGTAYWIYVDQAVDITLTGTAMSGGMALTPGWNFVAPYRSVPNPMDAANVLAAWAWDPDTGYFIPSLLNPESISATTGLWIYVRESTVIWNDTP